MVHVYLIRAEPETYDCYGYWSNKYGWTEYVELADTFRAKEKKRINMPAARGSKVEWVKLKPVKEG